MTPEQFLKRWKADHINSGTQQADSPRLIEQLMADAENEGITSAQLSRAAGGGLVKFIVSSIREAIEEEIW